RRPTRICEVGAARSELNRPLPAGPDAPLQSFRRNRLAAPQRVVWPQAQRRTPMNPKGDDRHFPLGSSSTAEERPATLQGARKLSRRPGRPYRTAPSKGARSRMMGELMSPDTPKSGGVISDGLVEYPRSAEPLA